MKLKNVLLVVEDIERSKVFYLELFGLREVTDLGGNVILTEGLVLQEKAVWNKLIGKEAGTPTETSALYFEEVNMDSFLEKLENYPKSVRYLHPLQSPDGEQRVLRLYDPDGHLIEVREMKGLR